MVTFLQIAHRFFSLLQLCGEGKQNSLFFGIGIVCIQNKNLLQDIKAMQGSLWLDLLLKDDFSKY